MAIDPSSHLIYYLCVSAAHKEYLGAIRTWSNLKVGFDGNIIWVKDLTAMQVDSIEIKTIPFKTIFYQAANKLFLQHSLLPERNLPSLLWTPIERALPVTLPAFNHNYFGLPEQLKSTLKPSETEQATFALRVSIAALHTYMETAPAIRTSHLSWAIFNETQAIILGNPLLPLNGAVYWKENTFLIPAGYALEWQVLSDTLEAVLNEDKTSWIIWEISGDYFKLNRSAFKPLSLSSFRLSIKHIHDIV